MTQRKMTKRQALNALLEAEEERKKIFAAQERLTKRKNKFKEKHSELSKILHGIIAKEYEKRGEEMPYEPVPIIFKNHSFVTCEPGNSWDNWESDIVEVNSVK